MESKKVFFRGSGELNLWRLHKRRKNTSKSLNLYALSWKIQGSFLN